MFRWKHFVIVMLVLALVGCMGCSPAAVVSAHGALYLTNCRLIDGTGAMPVENAVIVIRDGSFSGVGSMDAVSIPPGAQVVDLQGATVLPGFINAHVHQAYDEGHLKNWLQAGVTSVRDEAPHVSDFLSERDRLNKDLSRSTIISATPILTVPGGYGTAGFSSPVEAKEAVEGYISRGVDIVKTSIEDDLAGRRWELPAYEEIKAVVDAAHAKGFKVSVHISHVRNLEWAIDAGVDDIAHMVVEPLSRETADQMVQKGISWVPTLELWNGVSKMHSLDWINVAQENLAVFYKAGGRVALGTDFAGYTCTFDQGFPITEVKLMQKAGMSPMDIIVAGTRNAAFVCGREDTLGTVEAGKVADLLIVDGDPLANLNALLNVRMVVHHGEIVVGP